jgi:hypothetical protein
VNRPGQSKARIFGFEQALEVVAPQLAGSGPTVAGFEGPVEVAALQLCAGKFALDGEHGSVV